MHVKCGISCTRWIVFFGFFIPMIEQKHCSMCGEMTIITAFLDSTVMLPCSFDNSTMGPVLWSKEADIVHITSSHQVSFPNHRMGRVIVFPNLSERGNFSILIDQLQAPDVGVYCCERGDLCRSIEIKQGERSTAKPHEEEEGVVKDLPIGIYIIIAGTVILIALVLACFYMLRKKWICVNGVESYYINHTDNKANTPASPPASTPPHPHDQLVIQSNNPQERVHQTDGIVYENYEHDPEHQQAGASLTTHFQRDINSWNQISHVVQPNYANQSKMNQVDKSVKVVKRRGHNYEIQNPIYGNYTEYLYKQSVQD